MSEPKLLQGLDDAGVLILTLNRPECLNAIDKELEALFVEALNAASVNPEVRVVVVAGSGERAFSAGYDVREIATYSPETFRLEQIRQYWAWHAIARFPKPIITANHALTLGWGAITSVSADIRIGCPETVFQFTASPHGGANLTWNLPQLVGWSKAKEYLMTSCRIEAEEALRSGLLNRVVPKGQVLEEAVAMAAAMATYPPSGVMAIKELMREGLGQSQAARLQAEMDFAQRQFAEAGTNLIEESYKDFFKRP